MLNIETSFGKTGVFQKTYPLDTLHGHWPFEAWLGCSTASLMRGEALDPRGCLFLDIETCEMGDTGILPFMVGVGFFNDDHYELWQYFLREPEEEPAMLASLSDLIRRHVALVTFNGKHFDVPVLEKRYRINNLGFSLKKYAHLDLLPLARQRWKNSLPSRRLIHLERDVLSITRSSEDIPGIEIPLIYSAYLNSSDFDPIQQVLYHNEMDVISMVTLAVELAQVDPPARHLTWQHLMDMGLWYLRHGKVEAAEKALNDALERIPPPENQIFILEKITDLLTQTHRENLAVSYWELWHQLDETNPMPRLSLAKYYESAENDPARALYWCELAYHAAENLPPAPQKGLLLAAIQKRRRRLQKKVGKGISWDG